MSVSRRSDSKSLSLKPYGTVYSTYELPGTRIYKNNEIHHGLVLITDGKSPGRPARLELSNEGLVLQVPIAFAAWDDEREVGDNVRIIIVRRNTDNELGFSIKGGMNGACKAPVIISKIWRDQENVDPAKQLFVGDVIIEINGVSLETKPHEEVVQLLKDAGDIIQLKVKHQKDTACCLKRGPKSRPTVMDKIGDMGTMSTISSHHQFQAYPNDAPKGWKTLVKIPLPMAYITRYLWGSDKLRPNAFEVRAVDGTSTGLIHCEDPKIVDQWVHYTTSNIVRLNSKSIKLSNKFLHPDELIVYLGWVCEKLKDTSNKEVWQSWEPRFLILKGSEVCLFEAPPLNTEDLNKCLVNYRVFETRFKDIKEFEIRDEREFVFGVETATGGSHYFSTESKALLDQLRAAWHRAIYYTVNRMQSKTFACNVNDRPSGLVFDIKHGIGLYDIHKKKYVWRYKFSQLRNSCDDGKMRIRLIFKNTNVTGDAHAVDLDCCDLYSLVYTLHNFLLSRVMSADPDYLEKNKF